MTERPSGIPETEISPELQRDLQENAAVYARFLIAETTPAALDPNKADLADISDLQIARTEDDMLKNMASKTYQAFAEASVRERKIRSTVPAEQLQNRVQQWSQQSADRVKQLLPAPGSTESTAKAAKFQPYRETMARFFKATTGKDDIGTVTAEDFSNTLYNRYFGTNGKESHVKQFAIDVVQSFSTTADDGSTTVDYDALTQNREAIQWLGNMFGGTSSEMISTLIAAEVAAQRNRTELVVAANTQETGLGRMNRPTAREIQMLEFVSGIAFTGARPEPAGRPPIAPRRPAPLTPPIPPEETKPPEPKDTPERDTPELPDRSGEPPETPVASGKTPEPIDRDTPPPPDRRVPAEGRVVHLKIDDSEVPSEEEVEPEEPKEITVTPEMNLHAALAFVENLRKRLEKGDEVSPGVFKDPLSGIEIRSGSRENALEQWFSTGQFTNWAEQNGLPLVYMIKNGNHAALLLTPPRLTRKGTYEMKVYDPMQTGEQREEWITDETFNDYVRTRSREMADYYDMSHDRYVIPPADQDPESPIRLGATIINGRQLIPFLFSEWLQKNSPPGRNVTYNDSGLQALAQGTYDLSLEGDTEIPEAILAGKMQQVQFNGKDCIPLSFYTAALRYAAKGGDNLFTQRGLDKFARDFGVRILPREQLVKKAA